MVAFALMSLELFVQSQDAYYSLDDDKYQFRPIEIQLSGAYRRGSFCQHCH